MNDLYQLLTTPYKGGNLLAMLRTLEFSSDQNGSAFYPQALLAMIGLKVVVRLNWRQRFGKKNVVQRKCRSFILGL